MKFFSSNHSVNGSIGTYKHGRIEWEQRENPASHSSVSRGRGPRIQVVIPNAQRNRPLPTSPFFNNPQNNSHIRSASVEIETVDDSSPEAEPAAPVELDTTPLRPSRDSDLSTQSQASKPITERASQAISRGGHSSDDSHGDDSSSTYSDRSSATSAEIGSPIMSQRTLKLHKRSASAVFSVHSPVLAGVFDSPPRVTSKSVGPGAETGPLETSPLRPQRRYAPHPPIEEDLEFIPTCALRPLRLVSKNSLSRTSTIRKPSGCGTRRLSSNPAMGVINQAISRSKTRHFASSLPSPTLSEAEIDLQQELSSFVDDHLSTATDDYDLNPFNWDDLLSRDDFVTSPPLASPFSMPRKDSITIEMPISPPVLPPRSSKRDSMRPGAFDGFRLSHVPTDHIASQFSRIRSSKKTTHLSIVIPHSKRMTDDFVLSPIPIPPKAVKRTITPAVAENVILTILRNMESLDDLFTTAIVNRGFYRVFKRHELDLMKATLRRSSPPAWEHREICYPGHDQLDEENLEIARQDYTPTSYLQYYTRDVYIIAALKSLIKDKCQEFMRAEIATAIVSEDQTESARVDDALWRIWTFCKIFGSGKGREGDIVAQMDWLKGGELVHQHTCTHSIFTTDSLDMNDTLASAPECFAMGNEGGLSAEQLFDIMELWKCLGVLLQPFEGRTIQAREYGVYEHTNVRGGDIDGEEMALDEWAYFLLTFGLSSVLELAVLCDNSDPSAFIHASDRGWMNWDPPVSGGTRGSFLKDAASRVYEDKIALIYAESSTKEVQRQLSKQRIQRHITQLRQRNGDRLPQITMSDERPFSEWEDVIDNLSRPRPPPSAGSNLVSHIPSLRSAASTSAIGHEYASSVSDLSPIRDPRPPPRSDSPPRRTVAQPLLPSPPPSTIASAPSVADWDHRHSIAPSLMPSIDEHPAFRRRRESIPDMPSLQSHPAMRGHRRDRSTAPSTSSSNRSEDHPAFQQHPRQLNIYNNDNAENSADKAVYRIVEMGFTAEEAKYALRMTDLGSGLRVEAAVELLLTSI
ncbi:hypothetical protein BDV95DRAFT_490904 [Massariosphaeria phaeospora]|uniref:UBA domain-containing protein n=1 Tax=Massariosphaeria phaeospora TaxID=100035 RepID=A0A7C8IHF4_9PLEO|nr:hypothetical protein BDV95DRAFT_490904 [Massariosphaeria phaeospora]